MEVTGQIARQPPSPWTDWIGVGASTVCVLHCIVTPFLLSFSAVLAHLLPSEESTHRGLAIAVAAVGALALLRGFRTHRRVRVLLLMAAGLACIFAGAWWGNLLPHHWMEVAITFIGSAFMISAHRLNHTFCRQCLCAPQVCQGSNVAPAKVEASSFQP